MRFSVALPDRLAPRIQLAVVLTLLILGSAAGGLLYSLHRRDLVNGLGDSMTIQGALFEQSVRHAMLDRDPELLESLVRRLGQETGVKGVLLINKEGAVRFTSDSSLAGRQLERTDPTCLICHQKKPAQRGQTVSFRLPNGDRVLRNVTPIHNTPDCYSCHPSTDRVNGIFVIDHSLQDIEAHLRAEAWVFALGTLGAMFVLAIVLELILHRIVLRPIRRMQSAIAEVERGNLYEGLEAGGRDEMSRLAHQFNRMSENLGDSIALLKEREDYLQRILDSAEDAMVVVDRDLRIVTSNHAYSELLDRSKREIIGQVCLFSPQCKGERKEECPSWLVFQTRETQRIIRRIADQAGEMKMYEIFASPLEKNGEVREALEVWRDITERSRLEAELAHSERLASLGLLASGISHEINNPLATITTCLDGLQRRYDQESDAAREGRGDVQRYFELIQKEVHRCRDLTTKLMLLSHKSSPTRAVADVRTLISETVSLLAFEISNRNANLLSTLGEDSLDALCDETRLRQVILNLLLNALDAIDEEGSIEVCAEKWGSEWIRITVSDNGCGIEPVDRKRIFEPFYSKRRSRHGSGLGLFISHQIIREHHGRIEVESRVGRGTRVTVSIPFHGGSTDA